MELVEHYRSEITLPYLPVRYEDIVDEQEESIRRMLDFIGAPFASATASTNLSSLEDRTALFDKGAAGLEMVLGHGPSSL